jgi:hypothetical protein
MRILPTRILPTLRRTLVSVLTLSIALACMVLLQHGLAHVAHVHGAVMTAAAPLLLNDYKPFGRTYDVLQSLIKPADANQPESIPDTLYDSQPYLAAGSSTLNFFTGATAANLGDPTLSNFPTGQLQAGYYFEVHRVFVIIDSMPANAASNAVTGPANDVEILHKTARGNLQFKMKGKTYGPHKLAFFGRPGGPVPFYTIFAAAASTTSFGETENNGGFPYLGNIIIPPITSFQGIMTFNSTAISVQTLITVALMGITHRPIA